MRGLPRWYRYFAAQAHNLRGDLIPLDAPSIVNDTRLEPCGVVAVIPSVNSPILMASFAVAPALVTGKAVVVNPFEHASTAVLRFVELFDAPASHLGSSTQ